jgi:hypothetical protein
MSGIVVVQTRLRVTDCNPSFTCRIFVRPLTTGEPYLSNLVGSPGALFPRFNLGNKKCPAYGKTIIDATIRFSVTLIISQCVGVKYAIREDVTFSKVFQSDFDIRAVRDLIKQTVEECSWEFVPVVRKNHATYQSIRDK